MLVAATSVNLMQACFTSKNDIYSSLFSLDILSELVDKRGEKKDFLAFT